MSDHDDLESYDEDLDFLDEDIVSDFDLENENDDSEIEFEDEPNGTTGYLSKKSGYLNGNLHGKDLKYKSWKFSDFIQDFFIDKAIDLHERQLPQCSFDDILIMLHYKNWQSENVINDYYDNWPKFRDQCGLPKPPNDKVIGFTEVENFECGICIEVYEKAQAYALSCNHIYCLSCYTQYIAANVLNAKLISCMHLDCPLTIPHKDIGLLYDSIDSEGEISGLKIEKRLNTNPLLASTAKLFIETHKKQYKWCPALDCSDLVEITNTGYEEEESDSEEVVEDSINVGNPKDKDVNLNHVINVVCPTNHEFCYRCQRENHLPCPCWVVDAWIKKCLDDSETASWIQANTQACPKCDSLIEKNGGCNHMTCKKCHFEFCWICLGDWKEHGTEYYQCNRFDPKLTKDVKRGQQLKRLSLQRYLHFYTRFTVHESSMKGDQKVIEKVDMKMKLYMEQESKKVSGSHDLSWIDVQFLHDAIRALTNGRKTLKWTYCFAFYLEVTNFSTIFESLQDFLNKTVEDLSKIFEDINSKKNNSSDKSYETIAKYKPEIIKLSNLVIKRQKLLIEFAQSGLKQKQLMFIST